MCVAVGRESTAKLSLISLRVLLLQLLPKESLDALALLLPFASCSCVSLANPLRVLCRAPPAQEHELKGMWGVSYVLT